MDDNWGVVVGQEKVLKGICSGSYGAISSVEQRKSFKWGVGLGMLRDRRLRLGESGLMTNPRRGWVEKASEWCDGVIAKISSIGVLKGKGVRFCGDMQALTIREPHRV